MTIKMIAAVSTNGVIGQAGKIPWHYPEDSKFFRNATKGQIVIMGRKTFEECGVLKNRRNIVITSQPMPNVETYHSLKAAIDGSKYYISSPTNLDLCDQWICGGARLYEEGMEYASEIYLTLIPEAVYGPDLTRFPWVDPTKFKIETIARFTEDERLRLVTYKATTSDRCDRQSKS